MFMWRRRFRWWDVTALGSGEEHRCDKWLTESPGVMYAQKPCDIVEVGRLGDSGETTRRHFWVGVAVE